MLGASQALFCTPFFEVVSVEFHFSIIKTKTKTQELSPGIHRNFNTKELNLLTLLTFYLLYITRHQKCMGYIFFKK